MRYEIKSTRNRLDHNEFVYALIPFITKIVEEKGHAHIVVETERALEIEHYLGKGFGPLEIIPA